MLLTLKQPLRWITIVKVFINDNCMLLIRKFNTSLNLYEEFFQGIVRIQSSF